MRNSKLGLFKTTISSRVLLEIGKQRRNKNATTICKKTGITFNTNFHVLKKLEAAGLIESEKVSKCRNIDITEKGRKVAEHLIEIQKLLKRGIKNE